MTLSWRIDSSECLLDDAFAMHNDVVRIYEQAYNAHTFDFEEDVGRFVASDVTVVSGGKLGARSLLLETSEARADYVRSTDATFTINVKTSCVANLDTTVVLVAEGDFTFTYPDRSTCRLPIIVSSTLRLLNGTWTFQHVHFSRGWS